MKHIINSRTSLTNIDDAMIQPNAIDLRLLRVFKIENTDFILSEEQRVHRVVTEIKENDEGYYELEGGKQYSVLLDHEIKIGQGEAGFLIPRSSLNRNGILVTSGLYDSGFDNQVGCVMHIGSGKAFIKKNTRVAQFLLFESESVGAYTGVYNKKEKFDEEK